MRRLPALLIGAALLAVPGPASAADVPGSGGVPATPPPSGSEPDRSSPPSRRGDRRRPVLRAFSVSPAKFYLYGRAARVAFEIADRSRTVRVRLEVLAGGRVARRIDLGDRRTGARHTVALTGREAGGLPQGELKLRIRATDPNGNRLVAAGAASASAPVELRGHHFPLPRDVGYGGSGSRFGAPRSGRRHQGQDLPAPEGMPVLAPRGGVVQTIAYQGSGAGNYVVLDGDGEDRDYVFMHLQTGSTRVKVGERVRTGERIARVGNTGVGTGPHLHFEIWVGGWYTGGHPIDPLPSLRAWAAWS